jgi:hypothetical protein
VDPRRPEPIGGLHRGRRRLPPSLVTAQLRPAHRPHGRRGASP